MSTRTPKLQLAGRRILLGVTGGIAAYKAADLTRRLKEAGADVQVVLTRGARRFIAARSFQALSGRPVRDSLWDEAAEAAMGHIELARWADAILVAPASADFIARLAQGRADDLLTTLCLASDRPLFFAPAMNRVMWANKATQGNLVTLKQRGALQLGPGVGDQACGEIGAGRLQEPADIRDALIRHFGSGPLSGLHAVVTAGPTREAIDPVRVLTNRSSGKMGFAVAQALAERGARVSLIAGPVDLPTPAGSTRTDVETAEQMQRAALSAARSADIFVGTAAVADYRPAKVAKLKIKKKAAALTLKLERTPDILATVRAKLPKLFMVGFAAETDNLDRNAKAKLTAKKLNLVAGNLVGNGRAFDRDDNQLTIFWPGGRESLGQASKTELARRLVDLISHHYKNHHA